MLADDQTKLAENMLTDDKTKGMADKGLGATAKC